MSPQLAPETDRLIERVNTLLRRPTSPAPFELAQLDGAIRRLSNVGIAVSQCFRGIYYALQGDLANTTKWFDMALCADPANHDVYLNYAASLCRFGQYEQAVKIVFDCISRGAYTPESLDSLLLCAYYGDDHAVLDEWLPKYEKLTGKPHDAVTWLMEDAEDEVEIKELRDEIRNGPYISLDQIRKELEL